MTGVAQGAGYRGAWRIVSAMPPGPPDRKRQLGGADAVPGGPACSEDGDPENAWVPAKNFPLSKPQRPGQAPGFSL